jgi:hypothetical protein
MRPQGEIRSALLHAAHEAKGQGGPCTLRDLASRACVGADAARRAVDNMRRAGQLVVAGHCRVAYRNRPVALYAPPDEAVGDAGFVDLAQVMTCWGQ